MGRIRPGAWNPVLFLGMARTPSIYLARAKIAVDHRGNFSLSKDSKFSYIFVL